MQRSDGSESGFTLLEVALVLALIALLSAIAVPAYRDYMDRAREARAIADIGNLSLQLYRWELNTGAFPETLAEAGLDGLLDPWQQPYFYLNIAIAMPGQVRKDKNLVPINTDFDLFSAGRDGATRPPLTAQSSRDDIIRASNGAFLGRAENY